MRIVDATWWYALRMKNTNAQDAAAFDELRVKKDSQIDTMHGYTRVSIARVRQKGYKYEINKVYYFIFKNDIFVYSTPVIRSYVQRLP